jgi:hypothetical protein
MKRIDFVIPYIMGPDNGLELRYALRSIAKNFRHTNYRIIIVGDKPDWLTGVLHFPFERVVSQINRAYTDQLLKLYSILTETDIGQSFVWTYDDVYFTSEVTLDDLLQKKAVASFDRYPTHIDQSGAGTNWKETMKYTMETVRMEGGSNYNYETHIPRVFEKKKVLALMEKYKLLERPMMLSSLYFNILHKNETPLCLFDSNPSIRFLLRSTFDVQTLLDHLVKHKFTNNSPLTWTPVIKTVLQHLFPEKSKYEK